jgi:nucleotide-binding universal stress UspA family protein
MRVLVGVDGSERSLQALEQTVERARRAQTELTVVVYGDGDHSPEGVEDRVRDRLAELSVDASVERAETEPGGRIVELAETGGYDQIVLPGGTRSPLGKIQFDSTVEFVLLNARTSVTLIR